MRVSQKADKSETSEEMTSNLRFFFELAVLSAVQKPPPRILLQRYQKWKFRMSHPKFVAAMDALKEFRSKIARIQTIKGFVRRFLPKYSRLTLVSTR